MEDMTADALTLVLGGTGKTGRRVSARLTSQGRPVRIASRSTTGSGQLRFDWEDPTTWRPVVTGAAIAYIVYSPDLAFPSGAERVGEFVDVAVGAGVRRLVLLSGRGEPGAQAAELRVVNSGVEWCVVRCSWFAQNFSEGYLLDPVLAGEIALPAGDIAEPFVDLVDVADVITAALVSADHAGHSYEVTGPRCLTFSEVAAELSTVLEHEVRYISVSAAHYLAAMIDQGVPQDLAHGLTELFVTVLDGRNATVGDGVERALGREPRDFAAFVQGTAASGVWRR